MNPTPPTAARQEQPHDDPFLLAIASKAAEKALTLLGMAGYAAGQGRDDSAMAALAAVASMSTTRWPDALREAEPALIMAGSQVITRWGPTGRREHASAHSLIADLWEELGLIQDAGILPELARPDVLDHLGVEPQPLRTRLTWERVRLGLPSFADEGEVAHG